MLSSQQRGLSAAVLVCLFGLVWGGCASTVPIRVLKPAEVDMAGIKKVAVTDLHGPSGGTVAYQLSSALMENEYYTVVERAQLAQVMQEHQLDVSGVVDPSSAQELGKLLGVDGLIFGEVSANFDPDEKGTEKVEKSVWTGEYEKDKDGNIIEEKLLFGIKQKKKQYRTQLVDQDYLVRRGSVSVNFKVVNVATGQIMAVRSEVQSYRKKAQGPGEIAGIPSTQEIIDSLAQTAVQSFVKRIAPHYVTDRKEFEKGDDRTQVAIQYGQNGLWDRAQKNFEDVVQSSGTAEAYYNLGIAYEAQGMYDKAEEAYTAATDRKPKDLYMKALSNIKRLKADRDKLGQQGL